MAVSFNASHIILITIGTLQDMPTGILAISPRSTHKLILAVLAIIGVAGVLVATSQYDAGLSPDSVGYISVARSLASGQGFQTWLGAPMTAWPPLYPFLLSLPMVTLGIDPLSNAHVLNAILFGLIIYFSGVLIYRLLDG